MDFWKGLCLTLWLLCLIPSACISLGPQPDPSRFYALTSLPRQGQKSG